MAGTLGIIGGMGPLATHAFYGHVIAETRAKRDQDHLHVLMDSDPAIPDRTAYLRGQGPDPRPAIITGARRLIAAGADLLVIPCNTANAFRAEIQAEVAVPVFDWIGAAAASMKGLGATRVGILATDGTLATGLYQECLALRGMLALEPSADHQAAVMRVIYQGVKAGRVSAAHRRELIAAATHLSDRGANAILLACTELPLAVSAVDARWPLPAIDPSLVAARQIVAHLTRSTAGDGP